MNNSIQIALKSRFDMTFRLNELEHLDSILTALNGIDGRIDSICSKRYFCQDANYIIGFYGKPNDYNSPVEGIKTEIKVQSIAKLCRSLHYTKPFLYEGTHQKGVRVCFGDINDDISAKEDNSCLLLIIPVWIQ